ncbi:MAG: adenylate/guanylate cyclase domain-containing protein [Alphaproteobacteria bacterium]|nr:MAG: adenylate/guanylate cyclase domain-containing protein [Alphaproteobacteria bacterium]
MSDGTPDTQELRRKLTTLLHADVCGYSRLMGQNELGTLKILKEYKAVVGELLKRHHGRAINWTGDGLLAEFDSVVEAVACGAEMQEELCRRNEQLSKDDRMDFRVGINLGDVMVDGAELFGEGVNIAARLQSIAPVGGLLISGTAFDQVEGKLGYQFDFVGRQKVKNIASEVPAYALVVNPEARDPGLRITNCADPGIAYRNLASVELGNLAPFEDTKNQIYAGFWRRAVAFFLDWSLILVSATMLLDLIGFSSVLGPTLIFYVLYMTAMETSPLQASLGKKIMGIKVVDENGAAMSPLGALMRNGAKVLSVLPLFIGFFMAGFTDKRQALHDKIAHSLLINEDTLALKQGRPQKLWT